MNFSSMMDRLREANWRQGLLRIWLAILFILVFGMLLSFLRIFNSVRQEFDIHRGRTRFVPACMSDDVRLLFENKGFYKKECVDKCISEFLEICEMNCRSRASDLIAEKINDLNEWQAYSSCAVKKLFLRDVEESGPFQWILIWIAVYAIVYLFRWYRIIFCPITWTFLWVLKGFSKSKNEEISIPKNPNKKKECLDWVALLLSIVPTLLIFGVFFCPFGLFLDSFFTETCEGAGCQFSVKVAVLGIAAFVIFVFNIVYSVISRWLLHKSSEKNSGA